MKTNLIPAHLLNFLGDNGLSMSEANHTANLCKEIVRTVDNKLSTITLFDEVVKLNGENVALTDGTKLTILDIHQLLINKTEIYSLSAWLREGIKAKNKALDIVKSTDASTLVTLPVFDYNEPDWHEIAFRHNAVSKGKVDAEYVFATFSVKQLAEYYQLEAIASHFGKAIHNDGVVAKLRDKVQNHKRTTLRTFNANGGRTDLAVISTLPFTSVDTEQLYFTLQEKHRDAEKKFNWYLSMIENQINTANSAEEKRYADALNVAKSEYTELTKEYEGKLKAHNVTINSLVAEASSYKMKVVNETAALKIVIPEALEPVLKLVKEYNQ
jgi:hypothetical protein